MGDQQVKPLTSQAKKNFLRHLLQDIRALEMMIEDGMIESCVNRIGAEQEYCLVGNDFLPSMQAPEILDSISDPHFTSELAKWNLEINLDPQDLQAGCFSRMQQQLESLVRLADQKAEAFGCQTVLTGILPTIRKSELDFSCMTPNPRYRALDGVLKELRGCKFSLDIEGVDEIRLLHDSILFEACNTSFQIHLQVDPDDFADRYNWAQVIAGPVLAACVNSPVLLGKELWSETRIALFRQSLDVRNAGEDLSDRQPRVAFGYDWLKESAVEIFKNDVAMYPLIISADLGEENAVSMLQNGEVPSLKAMNLHNGTLYKWNRACYGVGGGKAHLRIENRYIPSGPTPVDEIANTVFWVGLMMAMPDHCRGNWSKFFWFQDVRSNFLKSARNGLANEMKWFGESRDVTKLILDDLIPMAASGLDNAGIPSTEFEPFLRMLAARVRKRQTGSDWTIDSLRQLRQKNTVADSMLLITESMTRQRKEGVPVHLWQLPSDSRLISIPGRNQRVDSLMVTRLVTVKEDDLLDFADALMEWSGIHHLPVENGAGDICGIVSSKDIRRFRRIEVGIENPLVHQCMTGDVITVTPETSLLQAESLMIENGFGSLPVVRNQRVLGIVTASDILALKEK